MCHSTWLPQCVQHHASGFVQQCSDLKFYFPSSSATHVSEMTAVLYLGQSWIVYKDSKWGLLSCINECIDLDYFSVFLVSTPRPVLVPRFVYYIRFCICMFRQTLCYLPDSSVASPRYVLVLGFVLSFPCFCFSALFPCFPKS